MNTKEHRGMVVGTWFQITPSETWDLCHDPSPRAVKGSLSPRAVGDTQDHGAIEQHLIDWWGQWLLEWCLLFSLKGNKIWGLHKTYKGMSIGETKGVGRREQRNKCEKTDKGRKRASSLQTVHVCGRAPHMMDIVYFVFLPNSVSRYFLGWEAFYSARVQLLDRLGAWCQLPGESTLHVFVYMYFPLIDLDLDELEDQALIVFVWVQCFLLCW